MICELGKFRFQVALHGLTCEIVTLREPWEQTVLRPSSGASSTGQMQFGVN